LGLKIWSGDNDDKYPWQVSTNKGGAMQFCNNNLNNTPPNPNTPDYLYEVWMTASNELSTPKILYCTADNGVSANNTQGPPHSASTNFATLANLNISYFLNGDANQDDPNMIVTGDRNVGTGNSADNRPATTAYNASTSAAQAEQYIGNITPLPPSVPSWTGTELHLKAGDISLSDGSVQQATIAGLKAALNSSTNMVQNQWFTFPNKPNAY